MGTFSHPVALHCWQAGCLPTIPSLLKPYFGKASGMGGIKPSARRGCLLGGMDHLCKYQQSSSMEWNNRGLSHHPKLAPFFLTCPSLPAAMTFWLPVWASSNCGFEHDPSVMGLGEGLHTSGGPSGSLPPAWDLAVPKQGVASMEVAALVLWS